MGPISFGDATRGQNKVVPAGRVAEFLVRVFESAGTPDFIARVVADHLVCADLCGCDSHGVIQTTHYLDKVKAGVIIPAAMPTIVSRRGAAATVDAHNGWGLYVGNYATDLAVEMAMSTGIGAVSIRNCDDIGRLGDYVEKAADRAFVGFVLVGPGRPATRGAPLSRLRLAVPNGEAIKTLGTNSIAVGIPTGDEASLVAEFMIPVYQDRDQAFPRGVLLDSHDLAVTNLADYMDAYSLSLLTCLLGCLTGSCELDTVDMDGPFFVVIDPGAFWPRERFQAGIRSFLDRMETTPLAPRYSAVLVPRDFEAPSRPHRHVEGIELSPVVQRALHAAAEDFGVLFDSFRDIFE